MTTVNSNRPANLFVSAASPPANVPEELQIHLRPDQLLRATVVKAGSESAILEINRQHYLAQGERELRVGQKINLQVLQTQPRLEFKVLNNSLSDRLTQAFPLLTRSFDWSQLVAQLQQQTDQTPLLQVNGKIYHQLQQILSPAAGMSADLRGNIAAIVTQLQQLMASGETPSGHILPSTQVSLQPMQQNNPQLASAELSQTITQLIKNLQNQLSQLPKQTGETLPESWYVESRKVLAPLQQGRQFPQLLLSQQQLLTTVLKQIQHHSRVSPQLAGEVEQILARMERQVVQNSSQSDITAVGVGTKSPVALQQVSAHHSPPAGQRAATAGADVPVKLSAEIQQLLAQVKQGQVQKQGLAPELLGRLEGLLTRLQQLPQPAKGAPVILPGFEIIIHQLEQLVAQRPSVPQGRHLGLLSQLFGFYLEAELLQGKQKAALASLKSGLLGLQKELGTEVEEPLHRLELFQLCKAKLAEDQVQFLPLPFNELEEGYLLAEQQSGKNGDNGEDQSPLQMSLSLRLSALGNIRIDMLYEKEGLHLQLAGEDREKMSYMQNCTDELKESLQALELQGVSFSADAKLPARQLQERLLPDSINMLDARV